MISDDCISCGACESECPNNAIYPAGTDWELKGKTYGENDAAPSGATGFYSADHFYIVPDKCTECKGHYDESQCANACPVGATQPNPDHQESEEELLKKKEGLSA